MLADWIEWVMPSRCKPMKKDARSTRDNYDGICSALLNRLSNGRPRGDEHEAEGEQRHLREPTGRIRAEVRRQGVELSRERVIRIEQRLDLLARQLERVEDHPHFVTVVDCLQGAGFQARKGRRVIGFRSFIVPLIGANCAELRRVRPGREGAARGPGGQ
jgi:hypothetical protein